MCIFADWKKNQIMADAKKEVTDCIKIEKYIKIEPGGGSISGEMLR